MKTRIQYKKLSAGSSHQFFELTKDGAQAVGHNLQPRDMGSWTGRRQRLSSLCRDTEDTLCLLSDTTDTQQTRRVTTKSSTTEGTSPNLVKRTNGQANNSLNGSTGSTDGNRNITPRSISGKWHRVGRCYKKGLNAMIASSIIAVALFGVGELKIFN